MDGGPLAFQPTLALAPLYDFPGNADPFFANTAFATAPNSLTLFTTLPGDLNLDLSVGDDDLGALLVSFGNLNTTWIGGDLTGDGQTGDDDLGVLLSNFGTSVALAGGSNGPFGNTAVPEPGALTFFCGLSVLLLRRARTISRGRLKP